MSGDMDAAADAATGALWAGAAEPHADARHDGEHPSACLNCRAPLVGEFCYRCGQAGHVHKTLGSIGHDLLHGAFHFEGRIWRTLPMLCLHPGALTRRYIAGERARFVSPLSLFLFAVFLLFAVIHSLAGDVDASGIGAGQRADAAVALDRQIATAQARLTKLDRAEDASDAKDRRELAASLGSMRSARAILGQGTRDPGSSLSDQLRGWPRLARGIARAQDNPSLAIYKLQSSAYKYSWALILISTPFVALLFLWRRRFTMYDHAIFVIYSLDFMSLFFTLATIGSALGLSVAVVAPATMIVPPVHMFAQLRGAYRLRWWSAAWRTVALVSVAVVALALFAALLLGMGLLE